MVRLKPDTTKFEVSCTGDGPAKAQPHVRVRTVSGGAEEIVQLEVMLAELAAVVTGSDLHDTGTARGFETDAHGLLNRRPIEAVDDDLEYGVGGFGQCAFNADAAAQCR